MDNTKSPFDQNQQNTPNDQAAQSTSVTSAGKESAPVATTVGPSEFAKPPENPSTKENQQEIERISESKKTTDKIAQEIHEQKPPQAVIAEESDDQAQLKAPLTQSQAAAKVKGNLVFKNSSESMLWLAMLILRQYQLLRKKEQEEKNDTQ